MCVPHKWIQKLSFKNVTQNGIYINIYIERVNNVPKGQIRLSHAAFTSKKVGQNLNLC